MDDDIVLTLHGVGDGDGSDSDGMGSWRHVNLDSRFHATWEAFEAHNPVDFGWMTLKSRIGELMGASGPGDGVSDRIRPFGGPRSNPDSDPSLAFSPVTPSNPEAAGGGGMVIGADDARDVAIRREISSPTANNEELKEALGAPKIFIGNGSAVDLSETHCSQSFPNKLVGEI